MPGDTQAVLPVPPVAPAAPFETRAALLAWLAQHGVAHLARLSLEAVAPRVDPTLWPELQLLGARRRLIDLASAESLAEARAWLAPSRLRDVLPPLVARFLEDERDDAALARAAAPSLLRAPRSRGPCRRTSGSASCARACRTRRPRAPSGRSGPPRCGSTPRSPAFASTTRGPSRRTAQAPASSGRRRG
ncbi:hypothetical protein [Sorangium sp. So ce204]|uniref:hypothetical protein n=1 Tax=Sorangium sp. So ce204 TaxID=3133288 RepID=UPI003F63E399